MFWFSVHFSCFYSLSFVILAAESCWRCQGGDEDEEQEDCQHVGATVGKGQCRFTDSCCFLSEETKYFCGKQRRNGKKNMTFLRYCGQTGRYQMFKDFKSSFWIYWSVNAVSVSATFQLC